jgi:hypothetical protein
MTPSQRPNDLKLEYLLTILSGECWDEEDLNYVHTFTKGPHRANLFKLAEYTVTLELKRDQLQAQVETLRDALKGLLIAPNYDVHAMEAKAIYETARRTLSSTQPKGKS